MVAGDAGVLENNVFIRLAADGDGESLERNSALVEAVAKMENKAGRKFRGRLSDSRS